MQQKNFFAAVPSDVNRGKMALYGLLALVLGLVLWFRLSPIAGAGDVRVHVRCAHVFFMGMVDDFGFPDWDATAYGGRGTSMPRYVGPLPLAVASCFQLIGCDAALSVKLTVVFFAVIGLLGIWRLLLSLNLARAFPWIAVFAMVQPVVGFHLGVALFFQSVCANWVSPLLWLAANKVWQNDRRAILFGGIIFAILAWTHLLFAVMLGYAWVVLMGAGWAITRQRRFIAAAIFVPLIAGLLAAPYILPLLLTKNEVYYEEVAEAFKPGKVYCEYLNDPITDENGNSMSFASALAVLPGGVTATHSAALNQSEPDLSILQVISSPQRNTAARPWILVILLITMVLAIFGAVKLPAASEQVFPAWAWLVTGGFCAFMTFNWAEFLYRILPYSTGVQFPFRWALPAMGVWIPLLAAAVASGYKRSGDDQTPVVAAVEPNTENINWSVRIKTWVPRLLMLAIMSAGLWLQTLYWALPAASLQQFFDNPGHLQPFYPRAVPDPKKIQTHAAAPHQLMVVKGKGEILEFQAGVAWMKARLNTATDVILHINTHFDPYWRAGLDDAKDLPISLLESTGTMLVTIPAGSHRVELHRKLPAGRWPGYLIMLVSILLICKKWRTAE